MRQAGTCPNGLNARRHDALGAGLALRGGATRRPRPAPRLEAQVADDAEEITRELRHRAIGLLSRREHSRRELARKLTRVTPDAALIEQVLGWLAEKGLQSDERFSAALVRQRSESGYGPVRLLAELREHGLDGPSADSVLAAADRDWHRIAAAVRVKRFGPAPPGSRHELARQLRFLQYRGFTSEQSRSAVSGGGDCEDGCT